MNQQTQTDLGLTVQLDRPAIDGSPDHESISIPRFFSKQCVGPLIFELVQTGWQLLFLDIGWPLSRKLNSVWFNQAVIFNFNYDFLKKHNFSRNSRWPFQGQNDQFSKNFVKLPNLKKLFIYAHRDLIHIIIHHWTLKLRWIFETFIKYFIIWWLKNYVKIYTKKIILFSKFVTKNIFIARCMMVEELSAVQSVQWSLDRVDRYKPADCSVSSDSLTFELYRSTDMREEAVDWSIQLFHKIHIRCK